jgi:asparagine synthase (glutamine-hydrolysing)
MCGLAGEIAFNGARAEVDPVLRMTRSMANRGPDGEGIWDGGWVALGHRRLSIIDLSDAGAQPMHDPELGLHVVFNGCIYNYQSLRRELEPEYRFHSTSDTEVVLKAYDRWGEDFVDHLIGMFALVIVDDNRGGVVLARDRLGIKPLYLAELPGRLRFASTLPALVEGGGIDTSLDEVGLHHYLSWHSIVPAPRTVLRGIRKLPAATIRVIDRDGRTRERVYWQPDYIRHPERCSWTPDDWQEHLHAALRTAVQRRLVADVPVGVLLSGGLDSSLLVALLSECGQEGLNTFSIGFDGAGEECGDEFEYSDLVAKTFGTEHHRLHIRTTELAPAVADTVGAMTEPMGTQDVPAFYLLSRAVAEHVKVVQCGQGADEVFAGYAYHQPAARVARAHAIDSFIGAFADRGHDEMGELLEPGRLTATDVSRELLEERLGRDGAETALDAVLRLDTHTLMIDDPVKRVDSMTMAWGLEARVPFLDQDVVSLAASCPPELKAAQCGKGIVKDLARKILPSRVIDRTKGYFPVPSLRHLDEPFLSMVCDALLAPEARQRGLFRRGFVENALANPNARFTPVRGNMLWQLAVLEMWLQHHRVG